MDIYRLLRYTSDIYILNIYICDTPMNDERWDVQLSDIKLNDNRSRLTRYWMQECVCVRVNI